MPPWTFAFSNVLNGERYRVIRFDALAIDINIFGRQVVRDRDVSSPLPSGRRLTPWTRPLPVRPLSYKASAIVVVQGAACDFSGTGATLRRLR